MNNEDGSYLKKIKKVIYITLADFMTFEKIKQDFKVCHWLVSC